MNYKQLTYRFLGIGVEFLIVAGNANDPQSPGGTGGKIWIWHSKRMNPFRIVEPLHQPVSLTCGTHPMMCQTLMVKSTHLSDYQRRHTVFIPLQRGIYILSLDSQLYIEETTQLPSYSLSINHDKTMTLEYRGTSDCPADCTSLGVYEVGVQFYSLCAAVPNTLCTCELNSDAGTYSLRRCRTFTVHDVEQISNVVSLSNSNFRLLMFLVRNFLIQLNPIDGTYHNLLTVIHECTSVTHLSLDNTGNILYVHCTNNISIIYDLGTATVHTLFQGKYFYQCSMNTNITVSLPTTGTKSSITFRKEHMETHSFLPGEENFISGVCIMYEKNTIFMYNDRIHGTYLYNATSDTFTNILNRTHPCDQCEQIIVFGNKYPTVTDSEQRSVFVFDLDNFTAPIISLNGVSPQSISLISDSFPEPMRTTQVTSIQGMTILCMYNNIVQHPIILACMIQHSMKLQEHV